MLLWLLQRSVDFWSLNSPPKLEGVLPYLEIHSARNGHGVQVLSKNGTKGGCALLHLQLSAGTTWGNKSKEYVNMSNKMIDDQTVNTRKGRKWNLCDSPRETGCSDHFLLAVNPTAILRHWTDWRTVQSSVGKRDKAGAQAEENLCSQLYLHTPILFIMIYLLLVQGLDLRASRLPFTTRLA